MSARRDEAGRPSLLWVTQEVPDRRGGGGAIRQAALLTRLGGRVDIDLVATGRVEDPAVRAAVRSVVEVDAPPVATVRRARTAWELAVRRRPLFLAASGRGRAALRAAVRDRAAEVDAVVLHHEELLPLLPDAAPALRVLHLFDVKSERAAQLAAHVEGARSVAVWRAEAAAARRAERRWLPEADLVVACTADDVAVLEQAAGVALPAVVAPNGVDLARVQPARLPLRERVLFLGSLDYEPNVEGIAWFVEAVWPAVRAARPEATLTIAGHRPDPRVLALRAAPGVDVVGPVPDAAACLAEHDLVVVPLRVGTGSRLKAIEAMAAGRPVVGTTIGLEGLGVAEAAEPPAVVADRADDLADAVARLLAHPDEAARLARAGRRHVEAGFGWDRIAEDLAEDLLARLRPRTTTADPVASVSVLVCTKGRPALLARSLGSIAAGLRPGDELLVVEADGAEAAPLVAGLGGQARHLTARPGKSRQLNAGLRAARHPVVVLTDDDVEVAPGWAAAMAAPFADERVAAAFGDVIGLSGVRGVDVPALAPGEPPAVTWAYANGAAMAVRRDAVLAIGGFDERLGPGAPVHGEEHDLVLRLQEAGWTVRIADAPAVRHLDWRDEEETRRNLLVYSKGAGAFVGAALRRAPRRHARLAVRRARYQATLWRHRDAEGWAFGPATSAAFASGLLRGLRLRPWGGRQRRRRRASS